MKKNTLKNSLEDSSILMLGKSRFLVQCRSCGDGTNLRFKIREIPICKNCYFLYQKTEFCCMTKTRAKREFKLKDCDLDQIENAVVENKNHGGEMTLYLFDDILDYKKRMDEKK